MVASRNRCLKEMTPERWQRVKDLFEAAVWRSPPARSEFLTNACSDDEVVRREVESLLRAHDLDPGFMSTPVGTLLLDETALLSVGQRFGNYEQLAPIGNGGMGQVYSAIDSRLWRKIALKFLPSSLMHDTERVRRFEQEARAASALNHPNIVTIHEIGEVDSVQFIATEFVDGETLREHTRSRRISNEEVLNIGIQIGSALQAAHEAGIVHRDIKPENIMLRRDGIVKVLDFGLAKLAPQDLGVHPHPSTKPVFHTNPGVVMGTVSYMSPEQARAADVDARTDIWSLGVVLYEMVSGRTPFVGETSSHIIVSIIEHEPEPLSIKSEIPDELQRIVSKCLVKNRKQRYQSIGDLLADLKRLKQRLEVDAAIGGMAEPRKIGYDAAVTSIHNPVTTDDIAVARTPSRLVYFVRGLKSSRRRQWIIALMLALVAFITPAAYWRYKLKSAEPAAVAQINTESSVRSVAILPFENETQNPVCEYLSVAIPQTISTELRKSGGGKVNVLINSHSKFTLKDVDAQEVVRSLGVSAILTTRIVRCGGNIVLNFELIDARTKSQIWSEQYDRKLTSIVMVQLYISREIAQRLGEMAFTEVLIELKSSDAILKGRPLN